MTIQTPEKTYFHANPDVNFVVSPSPRIPMDKVTTATGFGNCLGFVIKSNCTAKLLAYLHICEDNFGVHISLTPACVCICVCVCEPLLMHVHGSHFDAVSRNENGKVGVAKQKLLPNANNVLYLISHNFCAVCAVRGRPFNVSLCVTCTQVLWVMAAGLSTQYFSVLFPNQLSCLNFNLA